MKASKIFLACLGIFLILSFSKESFSIELLRAEPTTENTYPDSNINLPSLSDEDDLKHALAELINEAINQEDLRVYFQHDQINANSDGLDVYNADFIFIEHLVVDVEMGASSRFDQDQDIISILENAMNQWLSAIRKDQIELFQNIYCHPTDFVLKFEWWSISTKEDKGMDNLSPEGMDGNSRDKDYTTSFFHEDQKEITNLTESPGKSIPIYAKKGEFHIKFSQGIQ